MLAMIVWQTSAWVSGCRENACRGSQGAGPAAAEWKGLVREAQQGKARYERQCERHQAIRSNQGDFLTPPGATAALWGG